uniref:hypothetical protein n=1 Tax=Nocardia asiatica TaxID=209252 RepID=UPI00245738B5
VIAPPTVYGGSALAELLARESITHVFLTPSVLASIEPAGLPALSPGAPPRRGGGTFVVPG